MTDDANREQNPILREISDAKDGANPTKSHGDHDGTDGDGTDGDGSDSHAGDGDGTDGDGTDGDGTDGGAA